MQNQRLLGYGPARTAGRSSRGKAAAVAVALMAATVLAALAARGLLRRAGSGRPAGRSLAGEHPARRPDRGIILFQSRMQGHWQIVSLDLASGARRRLTSVPADDLTPSVSPDGSWIAFSSD